MYNIIIILILIYYSIVFVNNYIVMRYVLYKSDKVLFGYVLLIQGRISIYVPG